MSHRNAWDLGVARSTVYAVLRRLGLHRLAWLHRTTRKVVRYESAHPVELIQLDVKDLARIPPGGGAEDAESVRPRCAAPGRGLIEKGEWGHHGHRLARVSRGGAVVGVAALVGATVFLFLRFRAGEPITIDPRLLLRLYLYVAIIAGLLVFTQGTSSFLRAGMAAAFGKDFSYRPVFVNRAIFREHEVPTSLELKVQGRFTEAEREELSLLLAEREKKGPS